MKTTALEVTLLASLTLGAFAIPTGARAAATPPPSCPRRS
jgi:hypothetical protein